MEHCTEFHQLYYRPSLSYRDPLTGWCDQTGRRTRRSGCGRASSSNTWRHPVIAKCSPFAGSWHSHPNRASVDPVQSRWAGHSASRSPRRYCRWTPPGRGWRPGGHRRRAPCSSRTTATRLDSSSVLPTFVTHLAGMVRTREHWSAQTPHATLAMMRQ